MITKKQKLEILEAMYSKLLWHLDHNDSQAIIQEVKNAKQTIETIEGDNREKERVRMKQWNKDNLDKVADYPESHTYKELQERRRNAKLEKLGAK